MNIKTRYYVIGLYVLLVLSWFQVSSFDLKSPIVTKRDLLHLTSSGNGINYLMLHGSIYVLFFLLLLQNSFLVSKTQLLIRVKRDSYIRDIFIKTIKTSLLFNLIFFSTLTVLIVSYVNMKLLMEEQFFLGVIISYLINIFYYAFVGAVFTLIYIITCSKTKALIFTFIAMALLFYMYNIYHVWSPIKDIIIFDWFSYNKLSIADFLFKTLRIFILEGFIFYITLIIFREKDIIKNETL